MKKFKKGDVVIPDCDCFAAICRGKEPGIVEDIDGESVLVNFPGSNLRGQGFRPEALELIGHISDD